MGSVKEAWIQSMELEPMYDWIEESFGDDAGEEGSIEWKQAVEAWEEHCYQVRVFEEEEHRREELDYYLYAHSQSHHGRFETQMISIEELLESKTSCDEIQFSLLVMLHSHAIASLESYLSSTFVHVVTNSRSLIGKLVDTDDELSKKKLTFKEYFEKCDSLELTVSTYLKGLVFHNIRKVSPLFSKVLNCEFGNVDWLYEAVNTRHHCAHRAGLDKDGNRIVISKESIQQLVLNCKELAELVEDCAMTTSDHTL